MSYTENEIVIGRNIEEEMRDSYLRYSMSVIIARALPDARDGLKPSQRRILYAMRQLNLGPNAKHRKCAKICGDTSGDYHPHGEAVIYPTLVRMAQSWSMRYTLINGQGNFGSIDGDMPAAMRYTEARLTASAVQLMEDLEKDTVDMVSNYDETRKEPTVFPSKFPNLLSNGSSGIAVGMATNIPPHNLLELIQATQMLLDRPETSIDEILEVMPGPDFPTGGVICGYRGIREAYHTGRGKIILRGTVHVEDVEKSDRQKIIIDEIPYTVNKARLVEQIAHLIHEKSITGIADLRDESDKDGLRICIDLKRGELPDVVINQLYKYSELSTTFGCNMLALDKGLPRTMNIKQLILAWIEHRIEVIRRRIRFELKKAESRAHILEGYLKAIDHLEEVIRLIRSSDSRDFARAALMEQYEMTERQANAVLDLKLYQLTGLERDKITQEYHDLLLQIAHYKRILADEALVRDIIRTELLEIRKDPQNKRRTQIIAAEGEMEMEDLIQKEPVILTISEDDYIKRMPLDAFKEQKRGGQGVMGMQFKRESDTIKGLYVATTHDHLLIFTSLGRCYWLKVWQVPDTGRRSKGKPLVNLLEDIRPEEKIAAVLCIEGFDQDGFILQATRKGIVKKTALREFSNPRRKGVFALNIDDGDELFAALHVQEGQQIMLFTKGGMAVRFDQAETRPLGRVARGVRGVTLRDEKDIVVGCEAVKGEETILVVSENGFGKRSLVDDFRLTKRGGLGVRSIQTSERNGQVVGALSVTDQDGVVMMSANGQTVRIKMRDVRVLGRNTQGVKLVNLKDDDHLVCVQKVSQCDEEEAEPAVESPADSTAPPEQDGLHPSNEALPGTKDGE
ncbi:MAG: gyrA [Chlamydiales bacterium]|jgi:DNA gyrase subunit A|nr:gyrA [Chlamydiales bacterium]